MDLFPLGALEDSMEMKSIRSLRPNVTREEAIRAFTAPGPASFLWKLRSGPLQRIADAYIPFNLYRVRYHMGGAPHSHLFALDAVDGSLDLFEFSAPPGDAETVSVSTRNHPAARLSPASAEELVREKVLRLIFQQGFFKVRAVKLEIERPPGEIHLPYWLGFYGTHENLRCRVMDAVRRRVEGARASALFEQWLAA
jgi:hypothetical protein